MNAITPVDPADATDRLKALFEKARANLGFVSNFTRVLAHAPAALEGYLKLSDSLADGILDPKIREQIALAVAEGNLSTYCLSAHTFTSRKVGLSDHEIANARNSSAGDEKTDAILKLAMGVLLNRGEISEEALATAREAGVTDGEIIETVANVVLNILANYVSHVAGTAVDFPEVRPGVEPLTE
jgi:uncharacterized peroxidase-related enzyme